MVAPIQAQGVAYQPGMKLNPSDRVSAEQMNNPGLFTTNANSANYSGDLTSAILKDAGIPDPDEKKHGGGFFSKTFLTLGTLLVAGVGLRLGVFKNIKGVDKFEND